MKILRKSNKKNNKKNKKGNSSANWRLFASPPSFSNPGNETVFNALEQTNHSTKWPPKKITSSLFDAAEQVQTGGSGF